MRPLLCSVLRALRTRRTRRPTLLKLCPPPLCSPRSLQNGSGNGTLQSDPQLFDGQFDELVTELTERDIADPALTDALNRLREVCGLLP